MSHAETPLSIAQCADLCSVGRGTVHYWIKTGKLHAVRSGKSYSVPLPELLLFLRNTNRPVPDSLQKSATHSPIFRTHRSCWEYGHGNPGGTRCRKCLVFRRGLDLCLSARGSNEIQCPTPCTQCPYYQEILLPRVHFIHQIETPAVVVQDLFFIAGNDRFADICGLAPEDIPGLGIEQAVHPDSLPKVLINARKRRLNEEEAPRSYYVSVRMRNASRMRAQVEIHPLKEPFGAYLVLGEEAAEGKPENAFAKGQKGETP